MLILPILQKPIYCSAKKRCKYTQKPGAMQIYLHWYSDMFRGMFRYHSTQSRESNFRGESATDSWKFGSLSLWKRRKKRHNAYTVGESASNSRQTGALSPDRMDEECRQNSRRSDCPILFPGKVPRIPGKLVHFPGKSRPGMDYECI